MTVAGSLPNKAILNGEVDWVYEEELDDAQQLLLVAGLEAPGLSGDERGRGARVSRSPTGFPRMRRWMRSAIRSRATPIPRCAWAW